MTRKQMNSLIRRVGAIILILFFVFAGIISSTQQTTTSETPTANPLTPAAVVFPPVPPGGTSVVADYTYFHSSGLMSLPHIVGWEPAAQAQGQGAEQRIEPVEPVGTPNPSGTPSGGQISLVGVTFINSAALSVIHVFAERDPSRKAQNPQQLDAYYDKANLDQAWSNFSGGWKELNRGLNGDQFVINFELYLSGNTYLGRQVSKFDNDWLQVLRLVVPNNNPQLLDQLQTAVMPKYHLWVQGLSTPISWSAVNDYVAGYVIRYPPDWRVTDGQVGRPFTITGTLGSDSITLVTRTESGKAVKSEDDARAWLKANFANATVQTIKAENHAGTPGFAIAYTNPDPDGNQLSAVVTLLSGQNGTLYSANLQSSARGQNYLDENNKNLSPDFTRVRGSFIVIPTTALVPTLIPTITPVPSITPTPIGVPLSPPPPSDTLTPATSVATSGPPATAPTASPTGSAF